MKEKPIQETTSTYFNNILKKSVVPKSVEEIDPQMIKEFNKAIEDAFTDEAGIVKQRVKYLIPYIIQNIDWVEYGIPLEAWQLKYYYQRDRFLKVTGLSYDKFLKHDLLQKAINELGLDPDPVFEFILFLSYYFWLRGDLKFSSYEQLTKVKQALEENAGEASMEVVVNGKHFKFNNSNFIKALFSNLDPLKLNYGAFSNNFEEGGAREKIRALDFYLIKTLLDFLPTKTERKRGKYTQAERNFSLCVLNYCGRLQSDEPEIVCSQFNNATFDKLMRDFKDIEIPFAMELFL